MDKGSLGTVLHLGIYALTTMEIVMLYYANYVRSYFSLLDDKLTLSLCLEAFSSQAQCVPGDTSLSERVKVDMSQCTYEPESV